jgi:hypothetical protein
MNEFSQQDKLYDQQSIDQNGNDNHVFVAQVTQDWKSKRLDDQSSSTSNLSNGIKSNSTDENSNKNELPPNSDEPEKSMETMKKRAKPIPLSYQRRRPDVKYDSSNPKLLLPNKPTSTITTSGKKTTKSTPIFIPPKKTSPQPHAFSSLSFDESLLIKPKPSLERQNALNDDPHTSPMTAWTPSPSSAARFYVQSSGSSFDENSSDESDDESLLIRNKHRKTPKLESSIRGQNPVTIFLTDPYGCSSTLDPDNFIRNETNQNESNGKIDSDPANTNTLFPNSTFDTISPIDIVIIPSTPPIIHDKHTLDSIGEEEEEDDNNNNNENDTNYNNKTERNEKKTVNVRNEGSNQLDKEPLSRRWSDNSTDREKEKTPSLQSSLMKMASAASVMKQTENPPAKVSKTKYLLMKLHLTSSNKDDESNIPTPKKRIVRRAADKKRYQTQ